MATTIMSSMSAKPSCDDFIVSGWRPPGLRVHTPSGLSCGLEKNADRPERSPPPSPSRGDLATPGTAPEPGALAVRGANAHPPTERDDESRDGRHLKHGHFGHVRTLGYNNVGRPEREPCLTASCHCIICAPADVITRRRVLFTKRRGCSASAARPRVCRSRVRRRARRSRRDAPARPPRDGHTPLRSRLGGRRARGS